jgi:hypothetical protein
MTEYERDVRIETDGGTDIAKVTPPLFWTGIVVGTVGAVGAIGFGTAGYLTKRELNDGINDDGLTLERKDELSSRGDLYNTLAITGVAVGVVGYALALVAYGVDWNNCGPLVSAHRTCLERKRKRKKK